MPSSAKVQSNQLDLLMAEKGDAIRSATFSGDVRMEDSGPQPMQGNAGRVVMNFTGNNVLSTVHSQDNVRLLQHQKAASASAGAQDVEITARRSTFVVAGGRRLQRADTSGAAQIALRPTSGTGQQTLVTAGKFQAAL